MSYINDECVASELHIMMNDIGVSKMRKASHEYQAREWQKLIDALEDNLAQAMNELDVEVYQNENVLVKMIDGRAVITIIGEVNDAQSLN